MGSFFFHHFDNAPISFSFLDLNLRIKIMKDLAQNVNTQQEAFITFLISQKQINYNSWGRETN